MENRHFPNFNTIMSDLVSPDTIRSWSNGEVKNTGTINYHTQRGVKDGLFCEQIFGTPDDLEVKMGHIELAAPVVHPLYCRDNFDYIASLFGYNLKDAEYIKKYLRIRNIDEIIAELKSELDNEKDQYIRNTLLVRLKMIEILRSFTCKPEWMILNVIPVIPPALRVMSDIKEGCFLTSYLNTLYRRVIYRNNRLKLLLNIDIRDDVNIKKEKQLLHQTVNELYCTYHKPQKFIVHFFEQNIDDLESLPEGLITEDFFLEAFKQDSSVFDFLPEKLNTPEFFLKVIENSSKTKSFESYVIDYKVWEQEFVLQYLPENFKTTVFFLEVVKHNLKLINVPENLRTMEICLEAVKQDGTMLIHVPENLRTLEMYLEAVEQNGTMLRYVPENLRTPEMCLVAVKQNGKMLEYVPESLKTPEMCLVAVKQNSNMLRCVPENLRTLEVCLEAIKQYKKELTEENLRISRRWMRPKIDPIKFVPENLKEQIRNDICAK